MVDVSALKNNFTGSFKANLSNLSLKTVILTFLIAVLAVFAYIGWTRQNQASQLPENVVITFISPRAGLTVLGNTQVRAKLTSGSPGLLSARLNVDGVFEKNLQIEKVSDNLVNISGIWESSKVTPGNHNLEISVYNDKTTPSTLVGKSSIAVKSVAP